MGVDIGGSGIKGAPVDLAIGGVHPGHITERLDQGPSDDVGERDLATVAPGQLVVQDATVDLEELGGQRP